MKGYDEENLASPAAEVRQPLHQPPVGEEDHPLAPAGRSEGARVQSPPETGHWVPPGSWANMIAVDRTQRKEEQDVVYKLQ